MAEKTEILLKLKELSKKGINGEKENAAKLLEKLMKKYNISEEELNNEEIKGVYINLKNEIEVRLASQILYAFFDNAKLYKVNKFKVKYYTELTSAQEIEFKYMFSIYLEDFKRQELVFYRAFINKNNIFPKSVTVETVEAKNFSSEEIKERALVEIMMDGLEITQVRKALNS